MNQNLKNKSKKDNTKLDVIDDKSILKVLTNNPDLLQKIFHDPRLQELIISKSVTHSGPLPHPEVLQGYNKIDPNFSRIIFEHFKQEQDHRHLIDNKSIDGAINNDKRAQWMAYSLSLIIIISGVAATFLGHEIFGASAIGINLAALASAYLKSDRRNKNKKN